MNIRHIDNGHINHSIPGTTEIVKVTHIKDPSCFYTQAVCREGELNQLDKALAKQAITSPIPAELELSE